MRASPRRGAAGTSATPTVFRFRAPLMSSITLAFTAVGVMLALLVIRVPIAVSLGLVSRVGIGILRGPETALRTLANAPHEFASSWTLSAIPMFLLMGAIAFRGGLTASLFDAERVWLS